MPRFALDELIREAQPAPMETSGSGLGGLDQSQEISSLFAAPHRSQLQSLHATVATQPLSLISPIHRPMSRRVQVLPRSVKFLPHQAPALPGPSPFRSVSVSAPVRPAPVPQPFPHRAAPLPSTPSYPDQPAVPLNCQDQWRNDAGLFLGRTFRVCFAPDGRLFIPKQTYGGSSSGSVPHLARKLHRKADHARCSVVEGDQDGAGKEEGRGAVVRVFQLQERVFTRRPYADLLHVHRMMYECGDGRGEGEAAAEAAGAYCRAALGGGPERAEVHATMALVAALQAKSHSALLASFSEWLQADVRATIDSALDSLPRRGGGGQEGGEEAEAEAYDRIFLHLTGRQVDAACAVAAEVGDVELALLLAQAGEDTSMPTDMLAQVEWLCDRHGADIAAGGAPYGRAKLLQVYRVLAGHVDAVLEGIRADLAAGALRRIPGRAALDWRQCLGLYLWYGNPSREVMALPPGRRKDLFANDYQLHLSVQAAFQYYLAQVQQSPDAALVPYPFPWYLQRRGPDMVLRQPDVVRGLWPWATRAPCSAVPHVVRDRLRSGEGGTERQAPPGEGLVGGRAGEGAVWAKDTCFQLLHVIFPRSCDLDASLPAALDPVACSPHGMDAELSWHLHEVLRRMGRSGGRDGEGLLGRRLAGKPPLSAYQCCLLASQFATQLEFAGEWELGAYVAAMAAADEDDESAVVQWARLWLPEALMRHPPVSSDPAAFSIPLRGGPPLTPRRLALLLRVGEDQVLRWFFAARATALRGEGGGARAVSRRIYNDEEMAVCFQCEDWDRAHALLLLLLHPHDLEELDTTGAPRPPERTLSVLRTIANGLVGRQRLQAWEEGAGPVLALLEVWEQLTKLDPAQAQGPDGEEALVAELKRLAAHVAVTAGALAQLPTSVQRVVVGMVGRVVEALWRVGSEEEGGGWLRGGVLSRLNILPSKQLLLLHGMAVGAVQKMEVGGGDGVDGAMEFELEEC